MVFVYLCGLTKEVLISDYALTEEENARKD